MSAVIRRYPQPELTAASWYNLVPKTDIAPAADYLQGLEITAAPFWELLPRFLGRPNTLLVLDPPYVSTKQGAYASDMYFGMVQFLRLAAMVRPPFVFFSSTRSELLDYLELIVAHKLHNWQDWAGYQTVNLTAPLNYAVKYEDNMVYKF